MQELLKEIRCLEEVENQLAQKYKMASPDGRCIDSVAVFQEAERRARSLRRRLRIATKVIFWNDMSASDNDHTANLQKHSHLRYEYEVTVPRRSVPCESPSLTRGVSVYPCSLSSMLIPAIVGPAVHRRVSILHCSHRN